MSLLTLKKRAGRRAPVLSGPAASKDPRWEPDGMAKGMSILSYLLGGILVYGGLGWVGDHFLHLAFLLPVGIFVGIGLSMYLIIVRYGDLGSASADALAARKKATESDWARKAGRPERFSSSGHQTTGSRGEDTAR
ncbi:MAG: hypothetical protein J2P23_12135 [Microlunatus sp.]|nr:hypothetical protein [Microlunatus sp.]